MMGFRLMVNFRQPYLSRSIGEFWRRWHITLSTWFRDYLYLPLGGSRVGTARLAANLVIVFLVSGFWHGANCTFVVWGALHGAYIVLATFTESARTRLRTALGIGADGLALVVAEVVSTFVLVTIAWVFFRATSVQQGVYILWHMTDWSGFKATDLFAVGLPRFEFMVALLSIATVILTEWFLVYQPPTVMRLWHRRSVRWACYYAGTFAIVFFGVFEHMQFIYFQF